LFPQLFSCFCSCFPLVATAVFITMCLTHGVTVSI
jgi:hypothetical protein